VFGVYGLNLLSFFYSIKGMVYYSKITHMKHPCLDYKDLRLMMIMIWINMTVCIPLILLCVVIGLVLVCLPLYFIALSVYGRRINNNDFFRAMGRLFRNPNTDIFEGQNGFSMGEFHTLRTNCEKVVSQELITTMGDNTECCICLDTYAVD
jgi:hypothetical protein